jgi:hypothetical protein
MRKIKIFAAIITAGCVAVVYRADPDSPPKVWGVREHGWLVLKMVFLA